MIESTSEWHILGFQNWDRFTPRTAETPSQSHFLDPGLSLFSNPIEREVCHRPSGPSAGLANKQQDSMLPRSRPVFCAAARSNRNITRACRSIVVGRCDPPPRMRKADFSNRSTWNLVSRGFHFVPSCMYRATAETHFQRCGPKPGPKRCIGGFREPE